MRVSSKMNRCDLLVVILLCVIRTAAAVSLHLSTGEESINGRDSPLALYQAPPTYKESGKARLNSIIIKSKPYLVNDSTLGLNIHQIDDGKTWRREALVSSSPVGNIITQDKTASEDSTTQVTTISQQQDISTIIPQYTIDCTGEKQTCSETISIPDTSTSEPTFKPYSQEELDKYLYQATMSTIPKSIPKLEENSERPTNKLASIYIEDETVNVLESTPDPTSIINAESQDKSKSWNLVNSQIHKHPYDDRNGWVSLEPIPWSSSQIQKWEPNPHTRPQLPSWPEQHQPWSKPSHPSHPQEYNRPPWNKPVYDYSRPVQDNYQKPSSSVYNNYNHPSPSYGNGGGGGGGGGGNHWNSSPDIVTDGRPGYFPSEKPSWDDQGSQISASYHRPTQVIYHKPVSNYQTHQQHVPAENDGQWVLLSSTKGYSIPQPSRHRSYQRSLKPEEVANVGTVVRTTKPQRNHEENHQQPKEPSMKSHRTVRLTVLPPLNGTTNTTVSHGGLIEVEETQQTVDEAHREHMAKMMKLWKEEHNDNSDSNNDNNNKSNNSTSSMPRAERRVGTIRLLTGRPATQQSKLNSRNNAVLAAVGAGMIPATMAMLLPMVLGRKRRKREAAMELFIPAESYIYQHQQPMLLSLYDKDNMNKTRTIRKKPHKKINIRKKTQVVYF